MRGAPSPVWPLRGPGPGPLASGTLTPLFLSCSGVPPGVGLVSASLRHLRTCSQDPGGI